MPSHGLRGPTTGAPRTAWSAGSARRPGLPSAALPAAERVLSCAAVLDELELSRFEPLVGQAFDLLLEDDQRVKLELTEAGPVGELSARQAAELGKRVPFSLLFRGPAELSLPQAIRTLRHAEIGELSLFLVQLDRSEEASLFEAVFT